MFVISMHLTYYLNQSKLTSMLSQPTKLPLMIHI